MPERRRHRRRVVARAFQSVLSQIFSRSSHRNRRSHRRSKAAAHAAILEPQCYHCVVAWPFDSAHQFLRCPHHYGPSSIFASGRGPALRHHRSETNGRSRSHAPPVARDRSGAGFARSHGSFGFSESAPVSNLDGNCHGACDSRSFSGKTFFPCFGTWLGAIQNMGHSVR